MPILRALVNQANTGDCQALNQLHTILDNNPGIWKQIGDLSAHARQSLIRLVAGDDLLLAESIKRQIDSMERELAGEAATPLQQLAIDRVIATWLQLQHADAVMAKVSGVGTLHLARQAQAQRAHDAALKSFVTLQNLELAQKASRGRRSTVRVFGTGT